VDRPIQVLAYAGARANEAPRGVWDGERAIAITDVLWAWLEAGADPSTGQRRWFRVRLATDAVITLYYDEALEAWFTAEPDGPAPGGPA
jgi:hypothetical protein